MILNLTFAEISDYIHNHYNKTLTFSREADKEFCVKYQQNLLFGSVNVPVNIIINEVGPASVTLIYHGGFGIDKVIATLIAFLKARVPELDNTLVKEDGNRLRFNLTGMKQTRSVAKLLTLKDIRVSDNGFSLQASLK